VTLRPHKIHIRRVFQARLAGFYSLASQMGGMISIQDALFNELLRLPEGFRYKEELLPSEEESTFERLPFRESNFEASKASGAWVERMNMTIAPTVLISRKSILNQIPTAAPFVGGAS